MRHTAQFSSNGRRSSVVVRPVMTATERCWNSRKSLYHDGFTTRFTDPSSFSGEPIIVLFAGYMAFIFIILYTFTAGFTAIFENHYGLNKGETGLCFLPISLGVLIGGLLAPITIKLIGRDIAHAHRHGRARTEPECNLYTAMFGASVVPISLTWLSWTARPSISIWYPLAAGALFGFVVLGLAVASYQYIAATLEYHTASALSTIQAVRFAAAGDVAVLAQIIYRDLVINLDADFARRYFDDFFAVPFFTS